MSLLIRKILAFFVVIIMSFSSFQAKLLPQKSDDITILYTNDVHCSVDSNIGYAGLVAYKNEVKKSCKNVTLVDVGDAIQGDVNGTVSQGESVIDIMNYVGYDFAVLGNHEFDYGMEQLGYLIDKADFTYLGCNLTYSGTGENELKDVEPYEIVNYGNTSVAYIGVTTPLTIISSTPKIFQDENGKYIYGFEKDLYTSVQKCVFSARLKGADYVVLLSHLGDTDEYSPYTSVELIQNTVGVDAVLDSHAHNKIESQIVSNEKGDDVILSSTGTKFENIGKLVISSEGTISATLISDYTEKDEDTSTFVADIKEKYESELKKVIGKSEADLSVYKDGYRVVRVRETGIGDFTADAYRSCTGADIAFANGGRIRADIKAGDVTYSSLLSVNPFANAMCTVEATGSEILDFLEMSYHVVCSQTVEDGREKGEFGGFCQVSGIRFTVDTTIPSPVKLDSDGFYTGIEGKRRVSDVYVLENGKYVPLDVNKTYLVAGSEYILLNMGDGNNTLADCKVVSAEGALDYEMLFSYVINDLDGVIPASYAEPEGRINIK